MYHEDGKAEFNNSVKKYSIAASLEYGRIYSKIIMIFFRSFFIFAMIVLVFSIVVAVIYRDEMLYFMIFLFGIISIACYYPIERNRRLKAKIRPWLDDAVELGAVSKKLDWISFHRGGVPVAYKVKIQVRFQYNGKKMTRTSGRKGDAQRGEYTVKAGYDTVFEGFADRYIRILYSEKYDQVLILNDKNR